MADIFSLLDRRGEGMGKSRYKEGVEPETLRQGPARPTQNVPQPTPLLGARLQGTASVSSEIAGSV